MPPPDYTPYKRVMPNSGIATASPVSAPSEINDPTIQAYIAEQRAAREPWSAYLARLAGGAVDTAQGFLPTALGGRGDIGVSDIAMGAASSAYSAATLPGDVVTGRTQLFDPVTGKPTPEAIERATDFAGSVTLGAGAIPAEANALRMGAQGKPEAKPQTVVADIPRAKAPRDNLGFYSRAQEALLNAPQQSGTMKQFVSFLEKSGVKKPEIEALTKNYGADDKVTVKQLVNTLAAEEVFVADEITDSFSDPYANMPGGTNYRMLNIKWQNPDPVHVLVPYRYNQHNLPDNTLVHARLKDDVYTDPNTGTAKKILRVEELQSDWAQQGKGRWAIPATPDRIKMEKIPVDRFVDDWLKRNAGEIKKGRGTEQAYRDLAEMVVKHAQNAGHPDITVYKVDGVTTNNWQIFGSGDMLTPEEFFADTRDTYGEELKKNGVSEVPVTAVEEMFFNEQFGQDPAPFVTQGTSGVVPLAFKRLLLEAAQNGQEEIVFAPGQVHAKRWGSSNPATAEGLKSFYDDVLPKELQNAAKDVQKTTGVKGLEIARERRPFVPNENAPKPKWYEDSFDTWFENIPYQQQADLGFKVPNQGSAIDVLNHQERMQELKVINSRLGYWLGQGNSIEEAVNEVADSLQQELTGKQNISASNDKLIQDLENTPYDQIDPNSLDYQDYQEKLDNAYYRRKLYSEQIEGIKEKMSLLPKALGIYKAWDKEVNIDRSNGEALVVKLSPDLREYIRKNGLPRFAKGGIVDLAIHGAWA